MLTVILCLLVGVPLAIWAVRRFERAVVFHPVPYVDGEDWTLPEGGEDVWFRAADGTRLHGWFVRARDDGASSAATVIYFHGNGGNLRYVDWLAERLAARGFNVLLFDYRGYGRSEGRVTDERALYLDAEAAYDYVVGERGVAPQRVILYGQSLGTAAATDVASRRPCGALILESGLSSASEMAARILPWLPRGTHRFAANRLDSARKLRSVGCPVLVAHGERDQIIPVEQGRSLYAAAREPKRLIVIPEAGHNDVVAAGGEDYLHQLEHFMHEALEPWSNDYPALRSVGPGVEAR